MDVKEFADKLFDAIAARVDQFFKTKNIQGGVRCGDDMFSPMDKMLLIRSLTQFQDEAVKAALSTIDPEAIKRACAEAAVKWINEHYVSPGVMRGHPNELRAAILQAKTGWEKKEGTK